MKDLETTKYLIMSNISLSKFFRKTFNYNAQDKIYEEANIFFESQILRDINSIQYNSLNFDDVVKANQYLNILNTSINLAFWRISKYSNELKDTESNDESSFNSNDENYLENILKTEMDNETDRIVTDSLTEYLYQLNKFVREFRNNFFPNSTLNLIQDNYAVEDIKSNKIKMPLMAVRGQFSALIDVEKLLDENSNPINKSNAGRILCEHITFLKKDGKPYEESVVSKYFSSSFDGNDTNEFIEPYNECLEILERPKLKKPKKRTNSK